MNSGGSLTSPDRMATGQRVYLDYQATTPVDPRVLEAMLPYFTLQYGNAASVQHEFGRTAAEAVETARERVARLVGARAQEIVFTSGATESNNLALKGLATREEGPRRIVTSPTEHKSVLDVLASLRLQGFEIVELPVDSMGRVGLHDLETALRTPTLVVSIMAANNEIGTLAPLEEIGRLCRAANSLFHCDATQWAGKLPLEVATTCIDLLSMSAYKMYGQKGVGALYVRREVQSRMKPLLDGGGHERGLRSGTLNVPACVGMGVACEIAEASMVADADRLRRLSRLFLGDIEAGIPDVAVNGHPDERIPGNLNLHFPHVNAEDLMLIVPDVAVSSGSACSAASPEPSHVLRAIGLSYEQAECCVRVGVGRFTSEADVHYAAQRLIEGVALVRGITAGRPTEKVRV